MEIEQLLEMAKLFNKPKKNLKVIDGGIRIVVLQRGWVVVGRYSQKGSECVLTKASVIRNWGTTKGLGELVANGPTSSTKLDPCNGEISFNRLTVVVDMNCDEAIWASKLV